MHDNSSVALHVTDRTASYTMKAIEGNGNIRYTNDKAPSNEAKENAELVSCHVANESSQIQPNILLR